jgi:proteic killer suppression protein
MDTYGDAGIASQPMLVACSATRYILAMIRTFKHKGIKLFFETGSTRGVQASHAKKLRTQLTLLNMATEPEDMNAPGWKLHPLKGDHAGHWSVWVNGNWRLTFAFENGDAVLVDYKDYH